MKRAEDNNTVVRTATLMWLGYRGYTSNASG